MLMRFYGAGLRRILQLADDEGALDAGLLDRLLADQLVASLLVIHDLHPVDLATRVQHALDGVRPYSGRMAATSRSRRSRTASFGCAWRGAAPAVRRRR